MLLHGKSVTLWVSSVYCWAGPALPRHRMLLCPILLRRSGGHGECRHLPAPRHMLHVIYMRNRVKRTLFIESADKLQYFLHIFGFTPLTPTLLSACTGCLCLSRLDIDCAMHWAGHATMTLELMSFQTRESRQQNWARQILCIFLDITFSRDWYWVWGHWTGSNLISAVISITAASRQLTRLT